MPHAGTACTMQQTRHVQCDVTVCRKATSHTPARHMLKGCQWLKRHHRPQGRHWLKGHHRPQGRHMGGRASCILERSAYLQVIADQVLITDQVYPGAGISWSRMHGDPRTMTSGGDKICQRAYPHSGCMDPAGHGAMCMIASQPPRCSCATSDVRPPTPIGTLSPKGRVVAWTHRALRSPAIWWRSLHPHGPCVAGLGVCIQDA